MDMLPLNSNAAELNLHESKYSELSKWKSISQSLTTDDSNKKEIEKASRGFESMFLAMMFKEMKKAMLEEGGENQEMSFGADTLLDYSDLMLADQLSQTGTGMGIARMIYTRLTGGDELEGIRVINPEKDVPHQQEVKPKINSEAPLKNQIIEELRTLPQNNNTNGSFFERVNNRISNYNTYIHEASEKYNIPENIIKAVITTESAGRPEAKSHAGAKGLMQLMDGTAKGLGVTNSYDPYQNIMGGTKYIRQMLDMFDGDLTLALSAYNAGPGNVRKYDGIPPFSETQNYVRKVNKYINKF